METGDNRRWGERNIGAQPGKKIGPLITSKTHMGADVSEMCGAWPGVEGVRDFSKDMCMCVGIESTGPLLYGRNLLKSGAAVRENNKDRGGAGINKNQIQSPELGRV